MSVISGKHVLVVGDETNRVHAIEDLLIAEGATIQKTTCIETNIESIEIDRIDLVLLNHLHEGTACVELLNQLRQNRLSKVLPIFALVEDEQTNIEHALMLGAADYFTEQEDENAILAKIKIVLGETVDVATGADIDISLEKPQLSKSGVRVFVVEDDPLLRNLLAMRLDQSDFPYQFSFDGKDALKEMKNFKPDVVILDIMLPGMSGFDVLKELKSSSLKSVPVIIFSNKDSHDDKQKASELGADRFFVKAMTDLSELIMTIESLAK